MLRNWKTTLIGFATGVLYLLGNGLSLRNALIATGLQALGAVAADAGVPLPPVKK